MKQTFTYGKYHYEYYIHYSDRKTLSLELYPNLNIAVRAPHNTPVHEIEQFLERKWLWLHKKHEEMSRYHKKQYAKEYISGESFYYLGRQYMLKIVSSNEDKVKMERGRIVIYTKKETDDSAHNKKLLFAWYKKRRQVVFGQEYQNVLQLFDFKEIPQFKIRTMPKRWGSYTARGTVLLHPKLIQAPKEAIRYVILHELCHIGNHRHDKAFYNELERREPEWKNIKEKLEVRHG